MAIFSPEFAKLQAKLDEVLSDGVKARDERVAQAVANGITSMLDCDNEWECEDVQHDVNLLCENGFKGMVDEIKRLYDIEG